MFVAELVRWSRLLLHAPSLQAQIPCFSHSRILWMMFSTRSRCQHRQLSTQLTNFRLCDAATRETLRPLHWLKVHQGLHIHSLLPTTKCLQSVVIGTVSAVCLLCNSVMYTLLSIFVCQMSFKQINYSRDQWRRYIVAKQCKCTASLLPCNTSCAAGILK